MLTKTWLKNFKAHAQTEIEFRRITLFIGPNNSGKSSLGQALILLRQAAARGNPGLTVPVQRKATSQNDPYLYPEDQLIDLGDFGHIVRRGQTGIVIGLEGSLEFSKASEPANGFHVNLEVGITDNNLTSHQGAVRFSWQSSSGTLNWKWFAGMQGLPTILQYAGAVMQFIPQGNFQFFTPAGVTQQGNVPREVMAEIQTLQSELIRSPGSLLNSLHPIFPLRGLEERGSPLTNVPARNLERMCVADRTVALLSMLAYDLDLQERVSNWLDKLVQLRIKVPLLPGKRVTLLSAPTNSKGADSLFMNEGTGANQLPFILVPIGISPPGETILLAEPEVHLHPKMQSKLVSLLVNLAHEESRQFVIETHSEHILHSVLYAVAKGDLSPSDIAIYYFDKKNGIIESRKLEVSAKGQIEGGLPGFFEQSLDELSEYLEALKKN